MKNPIKLYIPKNNLISFFHQKKKIKQNNESKILLILFSASFNYLLFKLTLYLNPRRNRNCVFNQNLTEGKKKFLETKKK